MTGQVHKGFLAQTEVNGMIVQLNRSLGLTSRDDSQQLRRKTAVEGHGHSVLKACGLCTKYGRQHVGKASLSP